MKSIKYITGLLSLTLLLHACTHGFEDYNDNQNVPGYWEVSPLNLLEETLYSGIDGMLYRTWLFNGELMQYTVSGTSNNAYHRYVIGNAVMGGTWNSLYTWAANAEHMRQVSRLPDKADANTEGMSITLKVLYLSNATDIFGDIPCSEAFRSRPYYDENDNLVKETNLKPVFDTQKEVYRQLFAMLEKANKTYIPTKQIKTPAKDLLYQGNMSKWKKFNNSLYLRLLMRLSNRYTETLAPSWDETKELTVFEKIKEIIDKPNDYPIFSGNEDNATVYFSGSTPFENRFGKESDASFQGRRVAEYIISLMAEQQDPRTSTYFIQNGGSWNGLPSGATSQETVAENVATLNKKVLGQYTSPYSIMKYDEIQFILAEAAKTGGITGGDSEAKKYYEEGIRSSIKYWIGIDPNKQGIEETTIDNFINNFAPYDYTLENILKQKYIAQFWNGYEAWHDYRRTGYPQLTIGSGTFNDHILPTRFAYPTTTATTNPNNYATAVDRLKKDYKGSDNMQAPVWWSKQAAAMN